MLSSLKYRNTKLAHSQDNHIYVTTLQLIFVGLGGGHRVTKPHNYLKASFH